MIIPNSSCVYVDLDDTLAKTADLKSGLTTGAMLGLTHKEWHSFKADLQRQSLEVIQEEAALRGCSAAKFYDMIYISKARPGAEEFILNLRKETEVAFITGGNPKCQEEIVKALGFDPEIPVIGLYSPIDRHQFFILVDDLNINTNGVLAKMETLGAVEPEHWDRRGRGLEADLMRCFYRIEPWTPGKEDRVDFPKEAFHIIHKLRNQIRGALTMNGEEVC